MTDRLDSVDSLRSGIQVPAYDREACGTGIVHLGLGAFHRAHQAVYTDDALARDGGDWRTIGVSLRSAGATHELSRQDCLYTVLERGFSGTRARVVGSLSAARRLGDYREEVARALADTRTRIVSITVTEKGYGLDRASGGIDSGHPAIAADLARPDRPCGVAGLLVHALGARRAERIPPFAIMCCDNLPGNGRLVRGLLADFARRVEPDLAEHIEGEVAFPSTMVDRITPASGPGTAATVARLTGRRDEAAVETEAFRQWVIEDDFPLGRPAWEAGGAIFASDARPYEEMKLRMLNGSHSMLAYCGHVADCRYVRDVMADPELAGLVRRHLDSAAATLDPVPGIDLAEYAVQLTERFSNPYLAHETAQIAMDGSEKMPQRIFEPALEAIRRGQSPEPFAFATAAWMRFCRGRTDGGSAYKLRDPMADRLSSCASGSARDVVDRFGAIPGIVPGDLNENPAWNEAVLRNLETMLESGMRQAVADRVRRAESRATCRLGPAID